jgi:hypothetical protein
MCARGFTARVLTTYNQRYSLHVTKIDLVLKKLCDIFPILQIELTFC